MKKQDFEAWAPETDEPEAEYDEELVQLCSMLHERYPDAPDAEEIDQVPPEQIGKKLCRVAVCAEMPGVVTYFLIAGFRKGTDSDIVFCVSGRP